MRQLPLRIAADRAGSVLLIGLLSLVAALPVVTAPAAFAAGARELEDLEGASAAGWFAAFRRHFARSLRLGVLLTVLLMVAVTDLLYFLAVGGHGVGLLVGATGAATTIILGLLGPIGVVHQTHSDANLRDLSRESLALAASAPLVAALTAAACLALLVGAFAVPLGSPIAVGVGLLIVGRSHAACERRLSQRRQPSTPTAPNHA